MFKEIIGLDASKASQDTDVPTKIIKETADLFTYFVLPSINASFDNDDFPKFLKYANIIPAFEKGSKNLKDNYRPISILKNISKVYERIMFKQIVEFMDPYFSKFQCGFRKVYSTQQCLIAFIEKWKSAINQGKSFGAVLTDLSKAFDCLPHELLIAKLHAYNASIKRFEWFSNSQMKANPDKCHLLTSSMTPASINIKGHIINNSTFEKLLGVTFDCKLNFNVHYDNVLAKARQKVHVLARIAPYMNISKRKLIMNSFFTSQFNYCPLVWMCHSRLINNKINRLHETCLRIIYSDKS